MSARGLSPVVMGAVLALIALAIGAGPARADSDADRRVKMRIEGRLVGQVNLHFERLGIAVNGGVVTLTGSVASIGERRDAERIVGSVFGVTGVVNDLGIRPSHESSEAILHEVQRRLERRPRFQSNAVQASIAGTVITLTGEVQRGLDRSDAADIAASVAGVTRVDNDIRVLGAGSVPPETIRDDVRSVLLNPLTFGVVRDLEVTVSGSVVTLRGEVSREADRRTAERLALTVTGVTEVMNEIVVR